MHQHLIIKVFAILLVAIVLPMSWHFSNTPAKNHSLFHQSKYQNQVQYRKGNRHHPNFNLNTFTNDNNVNVNTNKHASKQQAQHNISNYSSDQSNHNDNNNNNNNNDNNNDNNNNNYTIINKYYNNKNLENSNNDILEYDAMCDPIPYSNQELFDFEQPLSFNSDFNFIHQYSTIDEVLEHPDFRNYTFTDKNNFTAYFRLLEEYQAIWKLNFYDCYVIQEFKSINSLKSYKFQHVSKTQANKERVDDCNIFQSFGICEHTLLATILDDCKKYNVPYIANDLHENDYPKYYNKESKKIEIHHDVVQILPSNNS